MGIRIDGTADLIKATDGSLTVEGESVNTTGIVTASGGFKVGTAATIKSNGNATFSGIVTATKLVSSGSVTGTDGVFSGEVSIPTWVVHTGDTNTKFGFEDPDVITATTAGSERVRITSAGRVNVVGIVSAAGGFVGDGSALTGVAAGVWTETAVGVSTIKQAGINTTAVKGTATGAARSEGAQQVHGNISLFDGAIMTDATLGTNLQIPAGKNALLIGPVSVTTGIAVTVETNATLVII